MAHRGERLQFGVFEFDPATGELFRLGVPIALKNRASRLLGIFLRHPGELLTRDGLRQGLWGDEVHVDYDQAIDNAVHEIRTALGDPPHAPLYIETLARRGYRWIAPLGTEPLGAHRPPHCIAVLPFACASPGHGEGECIADELTDEIITWLASEPALQVISRTSVMAFRDATGALPAIASQLGAEFIVTGTVAVGGSHARVNAQLLDATADVHLWAASFEESFRNRLSMERDMATRIADGIRLALLTRRG